MFKSENELDKFIFDDCVISDINFLDSDIVFELDALIVGERNSQNTNFTRSYADTAKMQLFNVDIKNMFVAGYKVFDADDNLLETIEDKPVSKEDYQSVLKKLNGAYLYRMLKNDSNDGKFEFDMEIESAYDGNVQDLRSDTFVISVSFDKCVISWDRYLNRVNS